MARDVTLPCHAWGLHKALGSRTVLAHVDLRCLPGEVVVVRGPNGCGKSTLLAVLAGLLEADEGGVAIAGHRLDREPAAAKARLGYVPDGLCPLPDLLVSELLALVQALHGDHAIAEAEVAGLRDRLEVTPFWHRRLAVLSFGQRKRALLLAALWHRPSLLVMDEPCNGLDPRGRRLVEEVIAERRAAGAGVVLTTNDAAFAERLTGSHYALLDGRLVAVAHRTDRP